MFTKPLLMNRLWPIMMRQAFRLEEDLAGWKRRIPFFRNTRKKKLNKIIASFGVACNDIVFDPLFDKSLVIWRPPSWAIDAGTD